MTKMLIWILRKYVSHFFFIINVVVIDLKLKCEHKVSSLTGTYPGLIFKFIEALKYSILGFLPKFWY